MSKPWRHAIVGVGVVGEWHVRVLASMAKAQSGSRLVAVCDLDTEKAKKQLEKNGFSDVPVFADEKEMLAAVESDVVHIATPSGAHADPAIMAMEAGRHVICEKPLEISLAAIDRMIASAKKNNVRLAGIFQNRWNRANRALYEAAKANKFGRITFGGSSTPWYRTDQYYRDGGWRGTWALDGGGAIMNQSVHAVDLIQWICGPIKQVSAYASSLIHPEIEVEDTLVSSVVFESGAYGQIMGATSMWPGSAVRIEIGGSLGTAVSDGGLRTYHFQGDDEAKAADKALVDSINEKKSTSTGGGSSPTDVAADMHELNIRHILERWEAGEDADTAGPEARKAVAIILALYESAKQGGKPVGVEK